MFTGGFVIAIAATQVICGAIGYGLGRMDRRKKEKLKETFDIIVDNHVEEKLHRDLEERPW